MNMKLDALRR